MDKNTNAEELKTVEAADNHKNRQKKAEQTNEAKSKEQNFSTRYEELKKQFEELQREHQDLKDRLLRTAAEFDNFKKRSEREYVNLIANANAELISDLLPVVDDLERFQQSTEGAQVENLRKAVELIYRNMMKVLSQYGVKPIESVGQPFDPEKHEALMQVESGEHPSGMVVEEHIKGYEMNERVLRHAKVIVSK